MRYIKFEIQNYRAIKNSLDIEVKQNALIPLVGINESGKTSIGYSDSQAVT
jgi:predicted ATP-dependent endonuclease of OLD family